MQRNKILDTATTFIWCKFEFSIPIGWIDDIGAAYALELEYELPICGTVVVKSVGFRLVLKCLQIWLNSLACFQLYR